MLVVEKEESRFGISGTGFVIKHYMIFQYKYETPFLLLQKKNAKKKKNLNELRLIFLRIKLFPQQKYVKSGINTKLNPSFFYGYRRERFPLSAYGGVV